MTNKVYDILKWVALVGLPALTALWLTLANIWGFPYAVLGISSINYAKKIIAEKGEK